MIAVLGGISADRVVTVQEQDPGRAWWEWMVGVGHALDTRVHQVLSIDYLFGRGESSGQAVDGDGATAAPQAVPLVTPMDQAHTLAAVTVALELDPLCGLIGASYGGAVALAFAAGYPEQVLRALVIGAADRSHPLATALRVVQRRIVQRAAAAGDEAGGVALARVLAMTTYRSDVEFEQRFSGPPSMTARGVRFPVEDYLDHHGESVRRPFHRGAVPLPEPVIGLARHRRRPHPDPSHPRLHRPRLPRAALADGGFGPKNGGRFISWSG